MATTSILDEMNALLADYTTDELVRLLSGKGRPNHAPADAELTALILTQLKPRNDIIAPLSRVFGASFLIQAETPDSVFYPLTRDKKIKGVLHGMLSRKYISDKVAKSDDLNCEHVTIYRVNEASLADHVSLAKSVALLRPDHNNYVAGHLLDNLNHINSFKGAHDATLKMFIGTDGVVDFTKHPQDYTTAVAALQRVATLEASQATLVYYAGVPQLQTSAELAKAYKVTFDTIQKQSAFFGISTSEAFDLIATNIDALTKQRDMVALDAANSNTSAEKLQTMKRVGEWITRTQERGEDFDHACKTYPNHVAAIMKVLPNMLKAEGRELGRPDKAAIRTGLDTVVGLIKQNPDSPVFDRLARIANGYPEDIQESFASMLGKAKLPARRMAQLLTKLTTPAPNA